MNRSRTLGNVGLFVRQALRALEAAAAESNWLSARNAVEHLDYIRQRLLAPHVGSDKLKSPPARPRLESMTVLRSNAIGDPLVGRYRKWKYHGEKQTRRRKKERSVVRT